MKHQAGDRVTVRPDLRNDGRIYRMADAPFEGDVATPDMIALAGKEIQILDVSAGKYRALSADGHMRWWTDGMFLDGPPAREFPESDVPVEFLLFGD